MEISADFIKKYTKQGPRYTSYPPATAFHTGFNSNDFITAVINSNKEKPENISIYIHIPFCPQRCFFCGCNTSCYENDEAVARYIECVKKEIKTIAQYIDKTRTVTQIHWGGGTPNAIHLNLIEDVMSLIRSECKLSGIAEIAIECNPAYLDFSDIDALKNMGFNRMSLGIQDFNMEVLKAINRKPPKNDIADTLAYLKDKGFSGINIDLIYGLPLQTTDSFKRTIERAIHLNPDRLVTFSYAHVPWFNEEQKKLENLALPSPAEKLSMLVYAINTLTRNNYETIGMDHFAKSGDELAIAKKKRILHRNFQGYCTKTTTGQVYAFGASSISQMEGCYAQNYKQINQYIDAIESNGIAIERGYAVSAEERIVRHIINEIMCNGIIDFDDVARKYKRSVEEIKSITRFDMSKISDFINDHLVIFNENTLKVNDTGMLAVRNIAMAFDPNLHVGEGKYSQTL